MGDSVDQIVKEGFTGEVDVYLAEDEEMIRTLLVTMLAQMLGNRIRRVVWMSSCKEVFDYLDHEGGENRIWMTDFTLTDGALDFATMRTELEKKDYKTGWVIFTGNGISFASRTVGKPTKDSVKIWFLPKPARAAEIKTAVQSGLDHVKGDGDSLDEDEDLPTMELSRVSPKVLAKPLKDFPDLKEAVRFLPQNAGQVVSENARYDLCGLVAGEFEELSVMAGRSYEEFRDRWFASFPREEELSRRECLLGLLKGLDGAEYVLDICIHDINNILARFNGEGPAPEQWAAVVPDIQAILGRSGQPFRRYHNFPVGEHPFWEEQNVDEVIDQVSPHFTRIVVDLPEDALVYCPAGSLVSILRTFYSNFEKVKRLSGQKDAELELFVYVYGRDVIFQISDNIKEFGDDQLTDLFTTRIRSEEGEYGMGTGLARTSEIIALSYGEVDSYHHREEQGVWIKKSPGEQPRKIDSLAVPITRPGMKKVFEFTLPLSSGE